MAYQNEAMRLQGLAANRLVVRIIEARGLKAGDYRGTSDPFVEVRIKNQTLHYKTKVIKHTTAPFWNEEFVFTQFGQMDVILLKVYDYDAVTTNDFLGELEVPVSSVIGRPPYEEWRQLSKRSGYHMTGTQGELKIQFRYEGPASLQFQQPQMQMQMQPQMQMYPQQPMPAPVYQPQVQHMPPAPVAFPPPQNLMYPPQPTYQQQPMYPPQPMHAPPPMPMPQAYPPAYPPAYPQMAPPPVAYPPPPQPAYYPAAPLPYTTVTQFVIVPQTYVRPVYQYAAPYSPYQPFMVPIGLPPHLVAKMMQASQVFRMFDTNCSGGLDKKEWKRAMWSLGYYMSKHDAKRLFRMIDRDFSGRISEREFCEYWCATH